jgi:hypothetical protein
MAAPVDSAARDRLYRSRQISGLLIVGAAILAWALSRAHWHEVFPVGWWHVW